MEFGKTKIGLENSLKIDIPKQVNIDDIKKNYESYLDGSMSDSQLSETIAMFCFVREFLEASDLCNALRNQLNREIESLNKCAEYRERIDNHYKNSPFSKTSCY